MIPPSFRQWGPPQISELQELGYPVVSLDTLRQSGSRYSSAIPILLKWLRTIPDLTLKESIVRTLSVPWAKPAAAKPLILEFRESPNSANSGLKWAIGNALEIVADDSVVDDLIELVHDRRHGKSREMLVCALGNMDDQRAVDVLIGLLDDEEVAGHAIMALGKLKAPKARARIEVFLHHPKA